MTFGDLGAGAPSEIKESGVVLPSGDHRRVLAGISRKGEANSSSRRRMQYSLVYSQPTCYGVRIQAESLAESQRQRC